MNVRDLVPWSRGDRDRSSATPSDSISPVLNLHREMNRLFEDLFRGFGDSKLFAGRPDVWPSLDVEETDREYRVTAELPGLEERDVEVLLQDGLLIVRGERKIESENRNRTYRERFFGRFERQIPLDREVDEEAVRATFKDGILTVTLPKSAQSVERTKRIPVNGDNKNEVKSH